MSDPKYLVIGSTGHKYVDCVEWDAKSLPNIVDYDFIILNVRSINDDFLKNISSDYINNLRKNLARFLISNGILIILTDFFRKVERDKKYPEFCNNYFWSPISISIKNEVGDTISIQANKFPKYFSKFKKWMYYFYLPKNCLSHELINLIGNTNDIKYSLPTEVLIKNRYDALLSCSYSFEIYKKKYKQEMYDGYYYFPQEPDDVFGEVNLLPLIPELDYKEALNLILEDIIGKKQTSLPPNWTNKIEMPLINEINNDIEELLKNISDEQSQIHQLTVQKVEIEEYKKLVYTDGKELEDIFKKCLESLGGKIEPAKYSNEEYCFIHKGNECPIEAKGVTKSVSLTHLRQLIDYVLKYEEETGKNCLGILLGNAWKSIPLENRNTTDRPYFPSNVIQRSNDLNIALISSLDFLDIYKKFLRDNSIGKKILDRIVQSKGVVDFSNIN